MAGVSLLNDAFAQPILQLIPIQAAGPPQTPRVASTAGATGRSGPAGIGLALLLAFGYQALRFSRDPVLDLRLFGNRDFAVANLTIWLGRDCHVPGGMFLIPVYLQEVRLPNLSPLHTGLALLPMGAGTAAGMVLTIVLYRLFGARPVALAGAVVLGLTCWLLRGLTLTTSIGQLALPLALLGMSIMLIIGPTQALALGTLQGHA